MKKVVIALTAIVIMASCKKENVKPAAPIVTAGKNLMKFVTVYDNGAPETETYTYDSKGKIAMAKSDIFTETFNFESATSLVVTSRFNSNSNLQATRECTLNGKGYVTKIVVKNSIGGFEGAYDYTYNADGYMTGRKLTYPSGTTYESFIEITDGNAVSFKTNKNNVLNANTIISYDNIKTDKTQLSNLSYWNVNSLFGKGSKNLKIESKHFNVSGTIVSHEQHAYELDAAGYQAKLITKYLETGKQEIFSYTYE